jgi:uncharacterized SAM-binding protein YcdF (DUF218 family)
MSINDNSILLVLGAPNSPEGLLSPMAISRLDTCFSIWQREKSNILLTGGFGSHFNTSGKPHAWYARQYLIGRGVPAHQILYSVESSNTVEDAVLSKPLIMNLQPSLVTIITSDYHLQRAGFIFCDIYENITPLRFIAAPSYNLSLEELRALMQHEAAALEKFKSLKV